MDLSAGRTHSNTVGVPSVEQPAFLRVAPGDPEGSYLVHKIEGRGSISGDPMPQGGPPLSSTEIADIRAWIAAGAMND